MYRVIYFFTDLQDDNYAYNVGDIYPREGVKPSKARIEELTTKNNRQHRILIEPIPEQKKDAAEEVVEKPKRGRKKNAD